MIACSASTTAVSSDINLLVDRRLWHHTDYNVVDLWDQSILLQE
jgi:hypothetical protein